MAVFPFATAYLNKVKQRIKHFTQLMHAIINTFKHKLKQLPHQSEESSAAIKTLLTIISKKMKIRDTFNFSQQDDPEVHFLRYRGVTFEPQVMI